MLNIWTKVLELLKKRLDPIQFETWFSQIHFDSDQDGKIILVANDDFTAKWIKDNYLECIKDAIWDVEKRHIAVEFRTKNSQPYPDKESRLKDELRDRLIPWMTFENFVVSLSNEVAYSACQMIVKRPGLTYNPLFIYGGVGIGKTHLLQSVAHELLNRFSGINICYMTGESYVNEVMNALKIGRLDSVRQRLRGQSDCLLIDDIQYLAGKDFAQEEFFHTFNELYSAQKQIVLTSDQLPISIPRLTDRLRSRFGAGLMVDIQPPEPELRLQILLRKAGREGIYLPEEVALYLAQEFTSSVRELEGALNRVAAHALIRKLPLTLTLAKEVMTRIKSEKRVRLTPNNIIKAVADYFEIDASEITSVRRSRDISLPRHIAMYIMKNSGHFSLQEIGKYLGGRRHTTILSGIANIEEKIKTDPICERAVKDIVRCLGIA